MLQEHAIIKKENSILDEFKMYEKEERENFSMLSNALRKSHEQERAQAVRTKYWSVIASMFGAFIGIIGTTVNNRIRMRELRKLVNDATNNKNMDDTVDDMASKLEDHNSQTQQLMQLLQSLVNDAAKSQKIDEEVSSKLESHNGRMQQLNSAFQNLYQKAVNISTSKTEVSSGNSSPDDEDMDTPTTVKKTVAIGSTVTAILGVLVYFLLL